MRAVVYKKLGPPSVLEVVKDWKLPARQPGQVKVAIKSTSYNPVDAKVRSGGKNVVLPKVPGGDVAGLVVDIDEGAKILVQFKKDDPVFALTPAFYGNDPLGGWAEYTYVREELLAPVPPNLSLDTEAGAVPLVSLTAFQAGEAEVQQDLRGKMATAIHTSGGLVGTQALESAGLKPGSRVLVHGGAGGVGHVAVQLAKQHWGANVVATSRSPNFVKGLGADEVVDYTKEDFAEKYRDASFDAIIDLVGGDTEVRSYSLLKPGATFVHIRNSGTSAERLEAGKTWVDKKYSVIFVQPNGEQLKIIAQLIADDKLKVHVDQVISLEEASGAEELAGKKGKGKIVIKV